MTAPSTAVKHFRYNGHASAPVLNGTAGTLIGVLDACLVTGYGSVTLNDLVVAGGIATATVSTGHGFPADVVLLIAGATPSGLNGEQRLLTRTTTTFTFDATGISDQTATGTITAKMAPAGWEKVYSETNLAVYRSADVTGTRCYLRVDDTGAQAARVVGYESMTDVSTGTGPFPTAAQMAGGLYWPKSTAANSTARGWEVFADSRTFYLHVCSGTSANIESGTVLHFGDFTSRKSGDAYSCLLQGWPASSAASPYQGQPECLSHLVSGDTTSYSLYAARSYTGLGSAITLNKRPYGLSYANFRSGAAGMVYPNGPDNALLLAGIAVLETTGPHLRGLLRGVYAAHHNCHASMTGGASIAAQGDLTGRRLAIVKEGPQAYNYSDGMTLIDITGPWG